MESSAPNFNLVRELIAETVANLRDKNIKTSHLVKFVPAKRRFFIFPTKPRFIPITRVWRLGVFLLDEEGSLYRTGETTRAVAPGYPGHTSNERERRRRYTEAAFKSGFEHGEVLYFDSPEIPLPPHTNSAGSNSKAETRNKAGTQNQTLNENGMRPGSFYAPLAFVDGEPRVLWNRGISASNSVPLREYLSEQLSLRMLSEGA